MFFHNYFTNNHLWNVLPKFILVTMQKKKRLKFNRFPFLRTKNRKTYSNNSSRSNPDNSGCRDSNTA